MNSRRAQAYTCAAVAAAAVLAAWYFFRWRGSIAPDSFRPFIDGMSLLLAPGGPGAAAANVARTAAGACAALFVWLSFASLGLLLLRIAGVGEDDPFERFSVASGVGLGLGALMILALGTFGALRREVIVCLLIVCAAAGSRESLRTLPPLIRAAAARLSPSNPAFVFAAIILLFMALSFLASAAPPVEPDTLWYHLTMPRLYLESGGMVFRPDIMPSNWPLNAEMLYTAAMAVGGETAAQMMNWLFGAALLLAAACVCRRIGGGGAFAAAAFVSIPMVVWEFSNTYSDTAVAWFKVLAALCALGWRADGSARRAALCGLMCGLAMGTKINGALGVFLACAIMFPGGAGVPAAGKRLRAALSVGLVAALAAAPWYARAWLLTGNPVWPFFNSVFGGALWTDLAARDYMVYLRGYLGEVSAASLARLPAKLLFPPFLGRLYWPDTLGVLAPALLLLLPAARRRPATPIVAAAAVYFIGWFLISQQARHLMPALALLCAALAAAFGGFQSGRAARAALCALMLLQFGLCAAKLAPRLPAAAGPVTREQYLHSALEDHDAVTYVNTRLPRDAKVLLLWGNSGYYLKREFALGDPRWQGLIAYDDQMPPERLNERLRDDGFTHILFINANLRGAAELDTWIRARLRLTPDQPTAISSLLTLQNECISRGLWRPVFISRLSRAVVFEIAP